MIIVNIQKQVVFATCHSAGGKMISDVMFDVVIIDEATQALEAVRKLPPNL
jgi:DNA polymerase alpha-associated DNA helicase A